MAKIEITKTELVWPGKYNEDGSRKEVPRVSLPFQVIETVNESRATREVKKGGLQGTLFDVYEGKEGETFEAGWRNKLIWGDNLLVDGQGLVTLLEQLELGLIPRTTYEVDFRFFDEFCELAMATFPPGTDEMILCSKCHFTAPFRPNEVRGIAERLSTGLG
jgi:adenine-specific DNA-methyltransferase